MTYILLFIGLFCLAWGAKWLVQGACGISEKLGIPSVIIGLTVVSIGTGSPEIVVTALSTLSGESDLAIGNIVGSNLCNTFLILGVASLVRPLRIHQQIVNKDLLIMVGASFLFFGMAMKGTLTRLDGCILIALAVAYFIYLFKRAKVGDVIDETERGTIPKKTVWMVLQVIGGLILLGFGGEVVVDSAVAIAKVLGISPLVIGMTIVAIGTSLPELATSLFATVKGELDMAVGNVVGSNIFNILAVLGIGALFAQDPITIAPQALHFDFPVMLFSAVLCIPIFFSSNIINRIEGAALLFSYACYITLVIIQINYPLNTVWPILIGVVLFSTISYMALKAKSS